MFKRFFSWRYLNEVHFVKNSTRNYKKTKAEIFSALVLDLDEVTKVLWGNWAASIAGNAELWLLEGTGISSQLVLSVSSVGVDVLQVIEKLGNGLLLRGERVLILGHGVADKELAAVSDVGLGNGVKELGKVKGGFVDGVVDVTTSTAPGQSRDQQSFLGNGKASNGGSCNGNLGSSQDIGGGAEGQGKGVKGHASGDEAGGNSSEESQFAELHLEGLVGLLWSHKGDFDKAKVMVLDW